MPSDELGEKTEQPTERRRTEARRKGNVARSTDLNSAGLMLAVAAVLYFFGIAALRSLAGLMRAYLGGPAWYTIDRGFAQVHFREITLFLAADILPLMLFLVMAALALNVVQIGFLIAPEVLQPKLSRLNPIEGAKRILSIRSLVKLGVSLGKLVAVAAVATTWIVYQLPHFLNMSEAEPGLILGLVHRTTVNLAVQLSLALILLAILDFAFQRWKHEQDMKMTKQEVREEMKQMEGDPLTRQRRRDAHRKLAQARELDQVKDADVVITNPTEIAVALKYDAETMEAPTVLAKGKGEIAGRIRRIAIEHGVPIIERKPLAQALYRAVKPGQTIPVEMYEVFVEIMAYIYRLTGRNPPELDRG